MINLVLEGNPVSVNALYRGRRFLTERGKSTKEDYFYQAKQQYKGAPLDYPIKVEVRVFFRSKATSDIDNVLKATFDSLTGILWKDDRQIMELHAYKLQDKLKPRIEIYLTELIHTLV